MHRSRASRGIARAHGLTVTVPDIAIRTGDTPAIDRARFGREAADILITTPESLFLLLTSNARARLTSIDTVIIDEIHALVPGKRGAHLALSLERLEALRGERHAPRCSASGSRRRSARSRKSHAFLAAQRPARRPGAPGNPIAAARASTTVEAELRDELTSPRETVVYRPVTIVNAAEKKTALAAHRGPGRGHGAAGDDSPDLAEPAAPQGPVRPSIWTSVHPRLLELIRAHQSTLLFVNSRRLAERLAARSTTSPVSRSCVRTMARWRATPAAKSKNC